jgi:K+-sensing histidine kinase KdpD
VGTCAGAAALLIPIFGKSSLKNIVPFLFLIVIALIASRFGSLAGVVGTFLAGLLFAMFLFRPIPSLNIEEVAARNNLIWMLLGGVILSDLLDAYKNTDKRPKS